MHLPAICRNDWHGKLEFARLFEQQQQQEFRIAKITQGL